MRLAGPRDGVLFVGLAAAIIVVSVRQIRYFFDLARDAEQTSGLALLPALVILTAVFLYHQQSTRQEAKAHAAAARAEVEQAVARAAEIERLVTFGQALGRSLDIDAIRDVVQRQLATLAGTDEAWVLRRAGTAWQVLAGAMREGRFAIEPVCEQIADQAFGRDPQSSSLDPVVVDGHLCLPMMAGGQLVGVLGVPEAAGPFSEGRRRRLAAAATLLGISLRNAQLFRDVRENSLRDGLTGCFNRAHGIEVIDGELRRARRSQSPVSLIMFDLDHFKEINDRYGHLCGDAVLASVGNRMREVLRSSDVKCRYGGEEFLVLLPETPLEGAKRVADTLRRGIAGMPLPWKHEMLAITASFGVTTALVAEIDVRALIGRADEALYRAKDQGRNCVRLSVETAVA